MARVRDLFDVSYGHSLELNRLTRSSDAEAINFVSRTAKNNGVSARIAPIDGLTPGPPGVLTVALGGTVLETFLQPAPFYTGFHVAILTPRRWMSTAEKLFWAMCIRANRYRYNYGRQANRTLADLVLPDLVPEIYATFEVPDYEAVRSPAVEGPTPPLEVSSWGNFHYGDLFEISTGQQATNRDTRPGEVPFVRATRVNNGIVARGDLPPMWQAGSISVPHTGNIAYAFYQPEPFFASHHMLILCPRTPLTPAAALFVCALIRAERFRFSFGRAWSLERMKRSTIRLPVTPNGDPDWDFAERFIRALPYSSILDAPSAFSGPHFLRVGSES